MRINVLLNIGKKPSGAARPIIEFCNKLSKHHDIVMYKAFNPNKNGLEYFVREKIGFLLKGRSFIPEWIDCDFPVEIIPRYDEKWIKDADITFFRSPHLACDVGGWSKKTGNKAMRVSTIHLLKNPLDIPESVFLIASSTMVYEKLKILYPRHKIFRVANGVNCEFFSYENRFYEKPQSIGMIFYGGKNAGHKGVEIGLDIFKRIKSEYPHLHFLIAGLKNPGNLPGYVEFIKGEKSSDMLEFYQNTDIFIFPSLEDAFPNPPMEAMACGCAVVTTDVGGIRDFATDESAIICQPGNLQQMLNAIKTLIENPEKWRNIAQNGRKKIKQFDYSNQAKILEEVFYEILSTS